MRKEILYGLKAGAISALPVSVAFVVLAGWDYLQSRLSAYSPRFANYNIQLLLSGALVILVFLALAMSFGGFAGLIFVLVRNKMPFHSTYVKAVAASLLLWFVLSQIWVSIFGPFDYGFIYLTFFVLDALIFGYLFDRWTGTAKSTTRDEPFIPRPD